MKNFHESLFTFWSICNFYVNQKKLCSYFKVDKFDEKAKGTV